MNYLDNPLYPKEIIHALFLNGTLELHPDFGFGCPGDVCSNCPADGLELFCSTGKHKDERKAIAALLQSDYPEFFV